MGLPGSKPIAERAGRGLRSRATLLGVGVLLSVPLAWGCASASGGHVKEVASSGVAYGTALDSLLTATEETAVDASSARALSEGRGVKTEAVRTRILEGQDKLTATTVGDLEKLRAHARLLKRYFQALADLADRAADESAAKAVAASAEALEAVGKELGASSALSSGQKDALGKATAFVVQGVRELAVARELSARASVIDLQLRIHQELLLALRDKLKADAGSVFEIGYARDIRIPFETDQIGSARDWISLRRTYLLMDRKIEALERASDAASRLRAAWKAYIENRIDAAALADALKQADSAVALAESVKKGL